MSQDITDTRVDGHGASVDGARRVQHTEAVTDLAVDLSGVELFVGLTQADLVRLVERGFRRRIGRGQVLFVEGEPSDHLFFVQDGRLRVFRDSPRGDEITLTFIEAGETIGELSVVDGQPRSASVDAVVASELLAVPSELVREVLRSSTAGAWAVAELLAERVRRLTDKTADLVLLDLPRRLGKLLLDEAVDQGGVLATTFASSQSDVAGMLGVTRQSLNRSLAALARRGWVRPVDGTRIELLDPDGLRRFVGS
jgi:CRP-like cAMP-binding protein